MVSRRTVLISAAALSAAASEGARAADAPAFTAGLLLFPGLTQLDLTGPFEVLSRMPGCRTEIVGKTSAAVRSDKGLRLSPDRDFASAPQYDLFMVPGGPGVDEAILDRETVAFVKRQCAGAKYVMGVCTGSLMLGAAGVIAGKRSGGHWLARDLLTQFGATVSDARMTIDGKVYTSGGVTAGIDMALRVAQDIVGLPAAEQIELQIEYDPEPPFRAGTPFIAPPEIVTRLREANKDRRRSREAAVAEAARRLAAGLPTGG